MSSIYEVSDWNTPSGSTYQKNDIVKHGGNYWYAKQAVPANQTPAVISAYWGGMLTAPVSVHAGASNVTAPHFTWVPSYDFSVEHIPAIKSIRFGDGYEQRVLDGINSDLIKINLSFADRGIKESRAILHFLSSRKAKDFFFFTPPSPYQVRKKFISKQFNSSLRSQDLMSITTSFEQVP